ncbi:unnamed protein product, partial [Chrysoparadoxa australica]
MPDKAGMEALVSKTLLKLQKECTKRERPVKEACELALSELQELGPSRGPFANQYFRPLELACACRNHKVLVIALDAISKLVARAWLEDCDLESSELDNSDGRRFAAVVADGGDETPMDEPLTPTSETAHSPTRAGNTSLGRGFADLIIETICRANIENDQAQLQLIKVLLTVVTSCSVEVHEASLLLAVRTIYSVYLTSLNPISKITAKASLQQMLNYVFTAMEQYDLSAPSEVGSSYTEEDAHSVASTSVSASLQPMPCPPTMYPGAFRALELGSLYSIASPREARVGQRSRRQASVAEWHGGFPSIYHKDAFLLFRALCKLSMRSEAAVGV